MWYHRKDSGDTADEKRCMKQQLVEEGRAHAALVFEEGACVGWCQFGTPEELPRIHNQRAYSATKPTLPDWRITCFFVGKGHRGKGIATAALNGAIGQIARLGGGHVEGYPEDTEGRKVSSAFLFNGSLSAFEAEGFVRYRKIGKHKWVVTRTIEEDNSHVTE